VIKPAEGHIREDVFAAYLDKSLPAAARAPIDQHLAECPVCRDELVSLVKLAQSIAGARRRLRLGGAVAAIAAVLLIAVVLPRQPSPSSEGADARLRETPSIAPRRIVAVSPNDSAVVRVDSLRFVWHRESSDAGYRLIVNDDAGSVAWTVDTADTAVALPDSVRLRSDRVYFWYVDAIGREGTTRATGLRQFRVVP